MQSNQKMEAILRLAQYLGCPSSNDADALNAG